MLWIKYLPMRVGGQPSKNFFPGETFQLYGTLVIDARESTLSIMDRKLSSANPIA